MPCTGARSCSSSVHGRRGIAAWLIGSVARRIAHVAQVPVLLVRGAA
jgi:nucleotide-binding universal stress UspA family protein